MNARKIRIKWTKIIIIGRGILRTAIKLSMGSKGGKARK